MACMTLASVNAREVRSQSTLDWPMFAYNAQHIGHNPDAELDLPPGIDWVKFFDSLLYINYRVNYATVVGNKVLITYAYKIVALPIANIAALA